VSETDSGPDEFAFPPVENPAATAAGGVAAEEPVTTAPAADIPQAEATPVKKRPWLGSPLHVHRDRGRAGVFVAVDDPVAAAPRATVPGAGQWCIRCNRLRSRRVGSVAGALRVADAAAAARSLTPHRDRLS
jgi:hypothetical protein